MRITNKFKGTKGFISTWERVIRFRYMITEQAKERTRILAFWKKHGTEATGEAFRVKRRTLFLWQRHLKEGQGKLEVLNPKRKTPKNKRRRIWDTRLLEEIRRLRLEHPNLGADKIHPLLLDFADTEGITRIPGSSTIERLIVDLGGLCTSPQKLSHFGKVKKTNRQKVLKKPKDLVPKYPGHVIALDTIEKQKDGRRIYILTAIDIFTRTIFAIATRSHSSKTFAHFFFLIMGLFPYEIKNVLTDNGSEFKKYLNELLKQNGITHYHTYPKTPKMNAHVERFNRTLQEEFLNYHKGLLLDCEAFNSKLMGLPGLVQHQASSLCFRQQDDTGTVSVIMETTREVGITSEVQKWVGLCMRLTNAEHGLIL